MPRLCVWLFGGLLQASGLFDFCCAVEVSLIRTLNMLLNVFCRLKEGAGLLPYFHRA